MNRFRSLIGLLVVALFAITACKTDPQDQGSNVDFKRTENEVLVRLRAEPGTLNPLTMTNNYATQVTSQIFLPLITIDPQTYEYSPVLAKARPTTEQITEGALAGGMAYTFELHEEAVWDNGTPVTAEDYIFTLKAVLNPLVNAQRLRPYLAFIKDVQVDPENPKKFTVYTNQKYMLNEEAISNSFGLMPAYVYDPDGLMSEVPLADLVDQEKAQQLAQDNENLQQFAEAFNSEQFAREKGYVVGCGPYQLESWETGQRIVVTKKENWWGDQLAEEYRALRAYPERLIYQPIADVSAVALIKSEEIDAVGSIPPADFLDMREATYTQERYEFFSPLLLQYLALYMNNSNPKLSDRRVRRAIAHAINVEEIIETVYDGLAQRAVVPVFPEAEYYNDDLKPIPFNIEQARTLLEDAGWTDSNGNGTVDKEVGGEVVELELDCFIAPGSETGQSLMLLVQGSLQQAGIKFNIVQRDFRTYMGEVRAGDYEMASGGRTISPTLWEPAQDWSSEAIAGGSNYANIQNEEIDALIKEIQVTLNESKRNELYKELQRVIYEEQPYVFLFHPLGKIVIHKRFDAEATSISPGYFPHLFELEENLQ